MTSASPATDPLLGATLGGRYRVTRRIAEGGMGAVYEAEQLALGRRVAIKVLHAHMASDEDIVRRFEREARATTAIGHPNIVEVVDFGTLESGARYLVLEYLDGRDLGRVLREGGPLSVGRAARLAMQIADGVGAAHAKGIVHRDLKPENAIVLGEGSAAERVKVVDFGISKIRDAAEGAGDARTRTGTALGTPYFMAPEQAQGKRDVDHRADVYALGVILFRLLTGHHPFDDASYPMLIVKICTEPAPELTTWRTDLPPELSALVARMLAKDPGQRPSSMEEVRAALAPMVGDTRAPMLTDAPGPAATTARVLTHEALAKTEHSSAALRARASQADDEDDDEHQRTLRSVGVDTRGDPMGSGIGTPMKVAFAAMALAVCALGAWALFVGRDRLTPREDEENAPLPTPGPPIVHALAPAAYGSEGWSWLNPRPRAMPTWFAVDVAGEGVIAMVGEHGAAAHFGDGLLYTWASGTDATLEAVRWAGHGEALAAGAGGALVRLTATGPHRLDSGTNVTLHALAVISPTTTLIAGDDATLLRLVGDSITVLDVGVTADLLAVHARRGEGWIAGAGGTILHFTDVAAGRFVRESGPMGTTLRAIGGCERGSLYAAGDDGLVARRHADGSWHALRLPSDTHETLTAIACDHGRAVIAGASGLVFLASGDDTVALESGYDGTFHGAAGASDESTWLVGGGGQLATLEDGRVSTRVDGPTVPLRDVGTIGGAIVAVGEWGRVVRETEHGFVLAESPTDAGLGALATIDDSRLVAVGDSGTMVEIHFDRVTEIASGTHTSLHDVVAAGDTVLVVGNDGTVLRGVLGALAASRIPDVGDLWAVDGVPSDAIVVGDHGFAAHFDGEGHHRIDCEEGTPGLRAVFRHGDVAYAAGERGTLVRIDATTCVRETISAAGASDALPTLNAIGLGVHGRPLAVGDEGSAFERQDDGTWTASEDLEVGRTSLRGLERIERYVYVVGTGGTILRRIVVDGS
ncbi:MAG: protein kinase [Sandaracinus sp.]